MPQHKCKSGCPELAQYLLCADRKNPTRSQQLNLRRSPHVSRWYLEQSVSNVGTDACFLKQGGITFLLFLHVNDYERIGESRLLNRNACNKTIIDRLPLGYCLDEKVAGESL